MEVSAAQVGQPEILFVSCMTCFGGPIGQWPSPRKSLPRTPCLWIRVTIPVPSVVYHLLVCSSQPPPMHTILWHGLHAAQIRFQCCCRKRGGGVDTQLGNPSHSCCLRELATWMHGTCFGFGLALLCSQVRSEVSVPGSLCERQATLKASTCKEDEERKRRAMIWSNDSSSSKRIKAAKAILRISEHEHESKRWAICWLEKLFLSPSPSVSKPLSLVAGDDKFLQSCLQINYLKFLVFLSPILNDLGSLDWAGLARIRISSSEPILSPMAIFSISRIFLN